MDDAVRPQNSSLHLLEALLHLAHLVPQLPQLADNRRCLHLLQLIDAASEPVESAQHLVLKATDALVGPLDTRLDRLGLVAVRELRT